MKVKEKIVGRIELFPHGSGNVLVDDEKIYIYKKNKGTALHKDKVEIEIIPGKMRGTVEGKVVSVIERHTEEFTGIVQKVSDYGFLIPDSKRMNTDFYLNKYQAKKYNIGERLLVKIAKWREGKKPECNVIKSLGMFGENNSEISSIIYEYNIKPDFPTAVEKESEEIDWNISEEEIKKRRDFRDITTVAIDPHDCKDRDDSLSYRELGNGNIEVGIHIADVSFFVKRNTEIDKEALKRGQSIYLVDRTIPMLPENLSNGICSLGSSDINLTYSFVFEFNKNLNIVKKWFGKGVVNLNSILSYEQAEDMINNNDNTYNVPKLNNIAKELRCRRNVLSFHKQELNFILDDNFKPIGVNVKKPLESHKLIEEFMLLTNNQVGMFLYDNKVPNIYRCHDAPDILKLEELKVVIDSYGHYLDIDSNDIRNTLKELLDDVKDTPEENMISEIVVRTMKMAYCSPTNTNHYGLNTEKYSWVTSPIRRFADVITHRELTSEIGYGSYIK